MKILVACEESQAVTIELRKKGHEAYSCDIIDCSGGFPEWHIKDDVVKLLDLNWDMIIAFPPCTYISKAGARHLYPKGQLNQDRYEKGMQAAQLFNYIYNAKCDRIAIENPVSLKIFNIPLHSQEIQPFMFGHPYTKKTRLWLKGLPPLMATDIVVPIAPYCPSFTSRKIISTYGSAVRGDDRKNRSKTFQGIAVAMAEQWC